MRKQILGCAAVLSLAGGGSDVMASADDPARPACCYTNPRYAGTCAVEPAKDETCASVLAYLNDPQSQGKSYCGNTDIRGGWKQQACAKPTPTASGPNAPGAATASKSAPPRRR